MQAAKSAQEDLRELMQQVKSISKEKEAQRQRVRQAAEQLSAAERDQIIGELDTLAELGELESLRLQMAMDRLSKMMSTLSNLLKQASETAAAITKNLK